MFVLRSFLLLCSLAAGMQLAAAQTAPALPTRPHRMGVPTAPSRLSGPSTYRNQNAAPAVGPVTAPAMSAQDRQAYENCPDPRRYGPGRRTKKMVRIR